ncbi:MAG: divergent polysaccharide deacetylase family protein [Deferribacterales bacterium]
MPPRKNVRKPAARPRRTQKGGNKKQFPIGILIIFMPLLIASLFYMMKDDEKSPVKKPAVPEKAVVEKKKEAPKPEKKPEPEVKIVEKTIEKTVEKPVEVVSAVNAVKLFMFDKGLSQDRISRTDMSITIQADSDRDAKKLSAGLRDYMKENGLEIASKSPLVVKDTHGEYSIGFFVPKAPKVTEKPKVETKPKAEEKKVAEKRPEPPKQTVKPKPAPVPLPAPKPAVKKPIKYTAKLAVVIDDCGYSIPLAKQLANIGYPVTFAIIPYTPYGVETAKIAKRSSNTVFIHFPMQPKAYPDFDPGKGALLLNMPDALIGAVTRANFAYFGMQLDGANNHTGSAYTEDAGKMEQALKYMKLYTGRFLDSHTSPASKAYDECRKAGMKCAANSTFLDNEEPGLVTKNDKENHVHVQLLSAAKKALSNGSSIAIGHLRDGTVSALPDALAEIEKMGVKIVPVTDLMQ